MNFHAHQDMARRLSRRFVWLFALATAILVSLVTLFVGVLCLSYGIFPASSVSAYARAGDTNWHRLFSEDGRNLLIGIAVGTSMLIGAGSCFKVLELRRGGRVVAESLGARLIPGNTPDPRERQLINVVEELAIAAGTPVPLVFLLDDASINAFAAGNSPRDAVIGVTQGSLTTLNRQQLQGIIAHEFSHIINGDIQLNQRLTGWLHGIMMIGELGKFLLHGRPNQRRRKNRRNTLLPGLGLYFLGSAGILLGNLIKAAISRQREYLADASAVRLTRNPNGIGEALQLLFHQNRKTLPSKQPGEFSHVFFHSDWRWNPMRWLSTHPQLSMRIERINPAWKPSFPQPKGAELYKDNLQQKDSNKSVPTDSLQTFATVLGAAEPILSPANVATETSNTSGKEHYAHIERISERLRDACHDPLSARSIIYGLAMVSSHNPRNVQDYLKKHTHPVVSEQVIELLPELQSVSQKHRMPLLELSLPALQLTSDKQRSLLMDNLSWIVNQTTLDSPFPLFIQIIVQHSLQPERLKGPKLDLRKQPAAAQIILSWLSQYAGTTQKSCQQAYEAAATLLPLSGCPDRLNDSVLTLARLKASINRLNRLGPLQKPVLLKAFATCIHFDGLVHANEYDFYRALVLSLDCPAPPLETNH